MRIFKMLSGMAHGTCPGNSIILSPSQHDYKFRRKVAEIWDTSVETSVNCPRCGSWVVFSTYPQSALCLPPPYALSSLVSRPLHVPFSKRPFLQETQPAFQTRSDLSPWCSPSIAFPRLYHICLLICLPILLGCRRSTSFGPGT